MKSSGGHPPADLRDVHARISRGAASISQGHCLQSFFLAFFSNLAHCRGVGHEPDWRQKRACFDLIADFHSILAAGQPRRSFRNFLVKRGAGCLEDRGAGMDRKRCSQALK